MNNFMQNMAIRQAQTINELIAVLEVCAKTIDNNDVKQMCFDAISKARGNV